jgi:hypothetical protein
MQSNGVLHTVDEQGLLLKQAAEIEADIHEEFCKSTQGLARKDHHLICQGRDDVMSM